MLLQAFTQINFAADFLR